MRELLKLLPDRIEWPTAPCVFGKRLSRLLPFFFFLNCAIIYSQYVSTRPAKCRKLNCPAVNTILPPSPAVLAIIWCSIVLHDVGGSIVLSKRTILQLDQYIPVGRLDSFVPCKAHPRTLEFFQHRIDSISSEFGRYSDPFYFISQILPADPLERNQIGWGASVNRNFHVSSRTFHVVQVWALAGTIRDLTQANQASSWLYSRLSISKSGADFLQVLLAAFILSSILTGLLVPAAD